MLVRYLTPLILIFLIMPIFADCLPMPPIRTYTYDFHAIQEKQQYAVVEVLSNYFEKINLFLALSSLDYESKNVTLIIPLKSVPSNVNANKISSKEFLEKYKFEKIEKQIEKQSLGTFIKNSSSITSNYLKNYLLSSLLTPLYFVPIDGRFRGLNYIAKAIEGVKAPPEGVEYIKRFEFEGGYMEIYKVESGATLEEFIEQYKDLEMPENLREAIDKYKAYYIALLNLKINPIEDIEILKKYVPNTLKELTNYIKANPDLTFECREYIYRRYYPGYKRCDEREIIKEKFANFINKAKNEAKTNLPKNKTENIEADVSTLIESLETYWRLYDHDTNCPYKGAPLSKCNSEENITIHFGNRGIEWIRFEISGSDWRALNVYASKDNVNWENLNRYCCYPSGKYEVDVSKFSSNLYLRFKLSTGSCCGQSSYITLSKKFDSNIGEIWVESEYWPMLSQIENTIVDFILSAYSNSIKGTEINIELPIKNEVYYPLGTGAAWQTPIEDTRILVKMDENLEASFDNVQAEVIYNGKRYYLWNFKNWNPDYDIIGKINKKSALTSISDSCKKVVIAMNENINSFAIIFFILTIVIGILVVNITGFLYFKEKRKNWLKNLTLPSLFAVFAPLVSLWIAIFLPIILKTKFDKKELKIYGRKMFILFASLFVLYILLSLISILL